MLLGVITAVTGEHAGSVRGRSERRNRDRRGQWESSNKYFHDTSPCLDHLASAHRRIAGACRPQRCQRLCCRPVTGITISERFRTIQIGPAAGATFCVRHVYAECPGCFEMITGSIWVGNSIGKHFSERRPSIERCRRIKMTTKVPEDRNDRIEELRFAKNNDGQSRLPPSRFSPPSSRLRIR